MTVRAWVEATLLALGVLAQLSSCVGIAVMDDPFDRLHFLSVANTLGPAAIGLAAILRLGASAGSLQILVIVSLLWVSGPTLTHALARAASEPERDDAAVRPERLEAGRAGAR